MKSESLWKDDIFTIFQNDQLCYRALKLFYETGHTNHSEPLTLDRNIRDFIYIDIRHKHVFTPDELSILDCVESASFLFTNGTQYFGNSKVNQTLDYFAVSIKTSDDERSQAVYDIHQIFSLFSPSSLSVILFEANNSYLISLACRRIRRQNLVILSDWYNMQEILDKSSMDSFDVAYLSDNNAAEFFQDFAFNIVRAPSFPNHQSNFILKNRKKNGTPVLKTDDLRLELFELELTTTRNKAESDNSTMEESDNENDSEDSKENEDSFYIVNETLFDDPTKILKWIEESE